MIKRFEKNKPYTLCLIQETGYKEFNTWCANVTYISRISDILEFRSGDTVYTVDLSNKLCTITNYDLVYDEIFDEPAELERYDFCHVTNIVKGWQF